MSDQPTRRGRPPGRPPGRPAVRKIEVEGLQVDQHIEAAQQQFNQAAAVPKMAQNPRARAKARAAQLLDNIDFDASSDEFAIDMHDIPDGWTYEWKRHTVLNAEDPSHQMHLASTGWEPVPANRHPNMMPIGYNGAYIERKGMMLYERPAEITDRFRRRDEKEATSRVQAIEEQLTGAPSGHFERNNKGSPLAKINKTYERMAIPE